MKTCHCNQLTMENHTAKNFVLQLGSLISLYLSLSFLILLLFSLINLLIPDAADTVWDIESAASTVRIGISMVVVFFPTYLIMTRLVNTARRKDPQHNYLGLTKWLIYLSLLVGGAALLVDLVVVIQAFLEGDITQRFILKAVLFSLVVGSAFYYYLLDARGHWLHHEKQSIGFGVSTGIVVLVTIILGFLNIDTPAQVRQQKLDDIQVSDLQDIEWRVQDYLTINGSLPIDLTELYGDTVVPSAPDDRPAYTYTVTETGFKLCATFFAPSPAGKYRTIARPVAVKMTETPTIVSPDNWEHPAGEYCFTRVVK